jgi:hypothetical protein
VWPASPPISIEQEARCGPGRSGRGVKQKKIPYNSRNSNLGRPAHGELLHWQKNPSSDELWVIILVVKLTVTQLFKKFPAFYITHKLNYRVHKSPSLVPIVSQINLVHKFPPYFPKIHSNIILTSTLRSSAWSLSFRFSDQNFVRLSQLSNPCYIPCLSHIPWLYHPYNIWWSVHIIKPCYFNLRVFLYFDNDGVFERMKDGKRCTSFCISCMYIKQVCRQSPHLIVVWTLSECYSCMVTLRMRLERIIQKLQRKIIPGVPKTTTVRLHVALVFHVRF